jgi:putative membrane protein
MKLSFGTFWKASLAGAIGGLAGGFAMNRTIQGLSGASRPHGAQAVRIPAGGGQGRPTEDPTMKAAEMALEELGAIRAGLTGRERGGTVVHYSFAAAAGASYSLLAEYSRADGLAGGLLFSAALWFGADFILLPLSGLSHAAPVYGWRVEALSLLGHLAYGSVLEETRGRVRCML